MSDPRRSIPSVDGLLESPAFVALVARAGRDHVLSVLRAVQQEAREGTAIERLSDADWYAEVVAARIAAGERPSVRRVINATGVVLHTNLGRAPLAGSARQAMLDASGYAALEVDLESGGRGSRHDHCVGLLRELTGAEAALVVNNNAAAVVLALNTLSSGREAVVSRGELVEIGGSFRVPEIMERSGARLREVGATNRTHPDDYAAALDTETGVILKVHRSNFRMEGFTAEVSAADLVPVAAAAGVPLVNDLGSGLLLDLSRFGLPGEPTARMALEAGSDVITLSGDKLLGGPQAGIVLGREELVARMRQNPLSRALRPDKLTLAALEATLRLYRDPDRAVREVPVLRMLVATPGSLRDRAVDLAERIGGNGIRTELVETTSSVGGGAFPGADLPATAVAVSVTGRSADALARALRMGDPAVVARIRADRLLLDPRTIAPGEEEELARAVGMAAGERGSGGEGA